MLYATSPTKLPGVGYAGSILAALGIFPTIPLMLAWGSGNAGASLKKGVIIGLQSGIGNLGGYGHLSFLALSGTHSATIAFAHLSSTGPKIARGSISVTALLLDFYAWPSSDLHLRYIFTIA